MSEHSPCEWWARGSQHVNCQQWPWHGAKPKGPRSVLADLLHILGQSGAGARHWWHRDGHFPTRDLNACLVTCYYALPVTEVVTHPRKAWWWSRPACPPALPPTWGSSCHLRSHHTGQRVESLNSSHHVTGTRKDVWATTWLRWSLMFKPEELTASAGKGASREDSLWDTPPYLLADYPPWGFARWHQFESPAFTLGRLQRCSSKEKSSPPACPADSWYQMTLSHSLSCSQLHWVLTHTVLPAPCTCPMDITGVVWFADGGTGEQHGPVLPELLPLHYYSSQTSAVVVALLTGPSLPVCPFLGVVFLFIGLTGTTYKLCSLLIVVLIF